MKPAESPEVDFAAGSETVYADMRTALRDTGCVVLRKAVHPKKIALYKTLIDHAFETTRLSAENQGLDWKNAKPEDYHRSGWPAVAWELRIGQISPTMFGLSNSGFDMYDPASGLKFFEFMHDFFGGRFAPSASGHGRRIHPDMFERPPGSSPSWAAPIGLHVDAQYHSTERMTLNFWTPLEACGLDAPGLQAVDFAPAAVRTSLLSKGKGPRRAQGLIDGDPAAIETATLFRPVFEPGDMFLFTNWTIHGTFWDSGMTRSRTSLELRFDCDRPWVE